MSHESNQMNERGTVFLTQKEYIDLLEMNRRLLKENVDLKLEIALVRKELKNVADKSSD